MPVKINGLPAHILLVHLVVVLVPLAAAVLVLHVAWPAARRRLGVVTPLLAFVALVLVPVTTHAGEWLQSRLPETSAIDRHVRLGHQLLPWALALFVLSAAVWALGRRYELAWRPAPDRPGAPSPRNDETAPAGGDGAVATLARPAFATARPALPVWVTAVLTVACVAVAVVTVVVLYRIGDSGSHAVWGPVANLPAR